MQDFISQSAWGRTLAPDRLASVVRSCREARLAPGQHAVRAGDDSRYWVGIIDGLIVQQVTNEEGKSAALTAACSGTWFGEGTLMKHVPWQYDAIAKRATRVALMPAATFDWLRDVDVAFNQFLARLLNDRLSHYIGLLATERLTDPDHRIAKVLASMFDPDLYPARPRRLPLSQADIALLCGMSRQRANAALHKLHEARLVRVMRTGIDVLDVDALRAY